MWNAFNENLIKIHVISETFSTHPLVDSPSQNGDKGYVD